MDLSIVIPVFNSEESLEQLLVELQAALPGCAQTYEVILVNDGSSDGSWELLQRLAARYPWVCAVDLMRNYGQHCAILIGIQRSRGQKLVTMDDDLQSPPSEVPKLLAKLIDGADVVYGTRPQERHGLIRNAASRATKVFLKHCLNVSIAPDITSFRAFSGSLRQGFLDIHRGPVFIDAVLAGMTQRFASVPVRHEKRPFGRSTYSWSRLFVHAAGIITAFSVLPLQLASLLGFVFTSFGGVLLVYILGSYLAGNVQVPGFTFLAAIICLFSGTQLIVLGIFGAYLARIHRSLTDAGRICVRQSLREDRDEEER